MRTWHRDTFERDFEHSRMYLFDFIDLLLVKIESADDVIRNLADSKPGSKEAALDWLQGAKRLTAEEQAMIKWREDE